MRRPSLGSAWLLQGHDGDAHVGVRGLPIVVKVVPHGVSGRGIIRVPCIIIIIGFHVV